MRIHTFEKAFLGVGAVLLVLFAGALVYATAAMGVHLPGVAGNVDPARVYQTPPFNTPGVRQTGPGRYEAVIVAQAFGFNPSVIRVPANAQVTFTATTIDVIHGFAIDRTRMNMMLIPGQVSRNAYTFRERGEYLLVCHEYCGIGHHTMSARVIVE
ncbi:MAG TPA: cytochrome c oxidase subunit II [Longimicrobium sp.]|nr:cytochrome c oxidase subunit II [Longimicrobium sp.]